MVRALLLLSTVACSSIETLDLSSDPSEPGVPVGVRTAILEGTTLEVWYPAADMHEGDPTDTISLAPFVGAEFTERVGDLDIPSLPSRAVRDATPRVLEQSLPVVLFSHGFGGFRTQSADLTSHLASRGYVVLSVDHPGRMLTDVLPCLLSPPAGSCDLFASTTDPGPAGLAAALDWAVEDDALAALMDLDTVGVFGHSAGGGSVTTFASEDDRVDAIVAMAGAGTLSRDLPSVVVGGSCDGVVPESSLQGSGPSFSQGYWSMAGAGHLAFSDLCRADLGVIAEELAGREDANSLFLTQLAALGTDGCPSTQPTVETCTGFMAPSRYEPLSRDFVTRFFDQTLKDGDGIDEGEWADLSPLP